METSNGIRCWSTRAYLAFPYSHPNPRVRMERVKANARLAKQLWLNGYYPVSSGVYWHLLLDTCEDDPGAYPSERFREGNYSDIASCSIFIAQLLTGWKESKGLKDELGFALKRNLPIFLGRLVAGDRREVKGDVSSLEQTSFKNHQLILSGPDFFKEEAGWRFK